jgi:hypothetical protein
VVIHELLLLLQLPLLLFHPHQHLLLALLQLPS